MRARRSFAVGFALILVVMLVVWRRHGEPRRAAPAPDLPDVSVVSAATRPIARTLEVAGVFQPYQEVDIHGKVSGYIRRINVDIGDRVRQGETLAVLEVPELQAQVVGAESGVERSRQQIAQQQEDVARAQAAYAATHANYERLQQAAAQQPGLIAAQELDNARAQDASAAAEVQAARAAVGAAEKELGMSRAERQQVASLAGYANIVAPFNGVVTARYADTGALIPAGTANNGAAQAVVRLAQSDVLRLRIPVPEEDVPYVHAGSPVTVRVQATGQTFDANVVRYTRDVSDATRTMETEVDIPNPDLSLKPGMYADTEFVLQQKPGALVAPIAAIVEGDRPAVWIVDSAGQAEPRFVTLGIQGANTQEITSGLSAGERVIVGGQATLHPGERVHAVPAHLDLVDYMPRATREKATGAPAAKAAARNQSTGEDTP